VSLKVSRVIQPLFILYFIVIFFICLFRERIQSEPDEKMRYESFNTLVARYIANLGKECKRKNEGPEEKANRLLKKKKPEEIKQLK
jgi:hypothetical protein